MEGHGQRVHGDPHLLHRVAIAYRHLAVTRLALLAVADGLDIDGNAVGRADFVLPSVEPADGRRVVVDNPPLLGEVGADRVRRAHDLLALLEKRQDGHLHRRQLGVEAEDHPLLASHLLFGVRIGHEGEERAVHAHRRLDDVGHEVLLALLVEVRERLAAELRVLLEVEVRPVGDAHQLAPTDREVVVDVQIGRAHV